MDMNEWNKKIIAEFRANEGQVGGQFAGMPLVLLHTKGAKSNLPRINPVAYLEDGDRYVVIASKAGAPNNPDWYHNLLAHPDIMIEVGTETVAVQASQAPEPERSQLYERMAERNPGFADYQRQTSRVIPVMILAPR